MMEDELNLSKKDYEHPLKDTLIVGLSAIIGSLIPLLPFLFFPVITGIYVSLGLAAFTLFITGMIKAKLTVGNQIKSGLEMLIIGMLAALIGYLIGSIFGNINF
jgi:predicted membrane protein (TIGR00267 family)